MKIARENKLVIFDFDGVICDSLQAHNNAYAKTFAFFGKHYPPKTREGFRRWYDSHWEKTYYRHGFSKKELAGPVEKYYWKVTDYSKSRAFPGIPEALKELEREGFLLAVVSTTPEKFVMERLRAFGIKKSFRIVLSSIGTSSKRETIALVLRKLGVEKGKAIMVGDTPADVESARANGIKAIAVSYGWTSLARLKKSRPDAIARKPGGITKLVFKLFRDATTKGRKK